METQTITRHWLAVTRLREQGTAIIKTLAKGGDVSDAQGASARGTLGTVRNATLLLELLSNGPPYKQLSELSEESGLSLPTVHRLLRSLVVAGLVEQEERTSRYGLGSELTRLSQRYLARLPVLGALSPYLISLRDQISATIYVSVLVRGSAVYVDRVDAHDSGLYRGAQHTEPALTTAAGRVLAARADDTSWQLCLDSVDEISAKEADHERTTWAGEPYLVAPSTPSAMSHEVAAPVIDGTGNAAAALSANLAANTDPSRIDMIAGDLLHVAKAAGRTLGHG